MFIGLVLEAPWPEAFPKGRLLEPEARHFTLLFLGEQEEEKILSLMDKAPSFPISLGIVGYFDEPVAFAHAVGYHSELGKNNEALQNYAAALEEYFRSAGIALEHKNKWLPHVTVARTPFDAEEWMKNFAPFPFTAVSLDLFKSMGNLHYESLWKKTFIAPFDKIPHTADIAFLVRGCDYEELYHHAKIALAFEFPPMVKYEADMPKWDTLDDVIRALNELVAKADFDTGCPFKAVSYHGSAKPKEKYLEWEMIVDV